MIKFTYMNENEENILVVNYSSELNSMDWLCSKFNDDQEIYINQRVFCFTKNDLFNSPDDIIRGDEALFVFATKYDEHYFKINKDILSTASDVLVHKNTIRDRRFKSNLFVATKRTNIMLHIEGVIKGQVIIGGELDNAISLELLIALHKKFPTDYELKKYVSSRVYGALKDDLNISDQPEIDYLNYLKRKNSEIRHNSEMESNISDIEVTKYQYLHKELVVMLKNPNEYNEATWQNKIMNLLLLLYPKYLYVYKNIMIKDHELNTDRFLDYLLVDFDGNVDIIEIKQPFDTCLVTKVTYRDNHVPLRELSGSIMQVEKYIFHLLRMGKVGEDKITKQINDNNSNQLLNAGINLKIVNPKGIIIMGRDSELLSQQKFDFEIIKRKYKNIVDILTYDDLLRRLNSLIKKFSNQI